MEMEAVSKQAKKSRASPVTFPGGTGDIAAITRVFNLENLHTFWDEAKQDDAVRQGFTPDADIEFERGFPLRRKIPVNSQEFFRSQSVPGIQVAARLMVESDPPFT